MEKFIDIPNFEGIYQISDCGNVKRLERMVQTYNGKSRLLKEKLMKPKGEKYFSVCLRNGTYQRHYSVGRLVYSLFNKVKIQRNQVIVHKDGNHLNCKLSNLKLITMRNFVAAKVNNQNEYTGITRTSKDGKYVAQIGFENHRIILWISDNKEECHKLYQAAKKCFEEYDRIKTGILSNPAKNRLINKSTKLART